MSSESRLVLSSRRIAAFDPSAVELQTTDQKPSGLWYACGDEWVRWLGWNDPDGKRRRRYKYAYEIEVDLSKMIVIRTAKELDAFDAEFWAPFGERGDPVRGVAWQAVAKLAGGIEICPYIGSRREKIEWYWAWDIASGCVWDGDVVLSIAEVPLPKDLL